MERLTIDTKLLFCDIAQCRETPGGSFCEDGYCDQRRVYERLREYERFSEKWKLGIEQMDAVFSRVNALGGTDLMAQYRALGTIADLTALAKARDDGRVVVLPCKRGDKVWRICGPKGRKFVAERQVLSVTMYSPGSFSVFTNCSDWLGKTVFLTRAEAEAALKGVVDHEDD